MLRVYACGMAPSEMKVIDEAAVLPDDAIWIDMVSPTSAEEKFVEHAIGIGVPTRDEMVEIEPSSRLYRDAGALFLTANLVTGADSGDPSSTAVSFVLTATKLVTVRYGEAKVFDRFCAHAVRAPALCENATLVLVNLLDAIVDRLADVLENVGDEMDNISKSTFRRGKNDRQQRMTNVALQVLLARIGHAQNILSKSRDSAVSLSRLISFLSFAIKKDARGSSERLKSLSRDLASLTDQTTYLGNNITFLLDAALGLINIEQNAIIKIFSVAAVIFMPPTLVASIYGMNFHFMPELDWHYGYPGAIGLMIVSAILPYSFFKSRGWL